MGTEFFGTNPGKINILQLIHLLIGQRGLNRSFTDFSGKDPTEFIRQGNRKIAVATIQFQQIPLLTVACASASPAEHMLIHDRIGLGKATFNLLVMESFTIYLQAFNDMILIQQNAHFFGPTDNMDAEPFFEFPCSGGPLFIQFAMIDQCDQHFAGQGAQIFDLKQALSQDGILVNFCK